MTTAAAWHIEELGRHGDIQRPRMKSASFCVCSALGVINQDSTMSPVKKVRHQLTGATIDIPLISRWSLPSRAGPRVCCHFRSSPPMPKCLGMRLQCVDDQLNLLVQIDAEPLGPLINVVAVDLGGEALVLELLLDARRSERVNAVGPNHAAGHHKACQLVAGQECLVERRQTGNRRRVEVGLDGLGDLRLALLAEPGDDQPRMLVGPAVVIGIVQQPRHRPPRLVGLAGTVTMSRPPHGRLDRPGMIPQRGAISPLVQLLYRLLVSDCHRCLLGSLIMGCIRLFILSHPTADAIPPSASQILLPEPPHSTRNTPEPMPAVGAQSAHTGTPHHIAGAICRIPLWHKNLRVTAE